MTGAGPEAIWVVDTGRLCSLMLAAGLSSAELARMAGLNGSTVRRVLEGKSLSPSINVALKIADALGVDVRDYVMPVRSIDAHCSGPMAEGHPRGARGCPSCKVTVDPDALRYAARHSRLVGSDGSTARLAFEAGLSPQCVRSVYTGRSMTVRRSTAERLAEAMGVEPEDILVPEPDPEG